MEKSYASGKRKTSVARAVISPGTGKIFFKGRDYKTLDFFNKLRIEEPLRIAQQVIGNLNFDVQIKVKGGGEKGQIEAGRLALARAIVNFTKSKDLEKSYTNYDRNLLIADVRRKEAYKPGDSKARAKRQTSYR